MEPIPGKNGAPFYAKLRSEGDDRLLKTGSGALYLGFHLDPLYRGYLMNVLPRMGRVVAGDSDSYRYLAESIRLHPPQEELLEMIETAGFERCGYHNLSGGVAAVHRGYKL
jgi:demethylmenaquinone methyltransferase/2-methoxy-6-polyprenyl-1,4-benzoquinol methylase